MSMTTFSHAGVRSPRQVDPEVPHEPSAVDAGLLCGVRRRLYAEGQADARADRLVGLGDPVRIVQLRLVAHDQEAATREVDMKRAPRPFLRADRHATGSSQ